MDMFGVVTTDGVCNFPEPLPRRAFGGSGYMVGNNLIHRYTDCFRWFLDDPIFESYSHVWLNEHDGIFIRSVPTFEGPLYAHHAGSGKGGYESPGFYHLPWIMSREMAARYVAKADELIAQGRTEKGVPDMFFGLVMSELGVSPAPIGNVFSINSRETELRWGEVEAAVKAGAWYVHGIKTGSQIERIVKLLNP
jgi:hypothetical protein